MSRRPVWSRALTPLFAVEYGGGYDQQCPISVVGTGRAGVATLIETIASVAYNAPDGAPRRSIVVIDSKDGPKPKADTACRLDSLDPGKLHPFSADEPPEGFPTFGQSVASQCFIDPGLGEALVTPTYRQINKHLDYVLELASISFAEQVCLDLNHGTINEIEEAAPGGPALIHFVNGTSLNAAKYPP